MWPHYHVLRVIGLRPIIKFQGIRVRLFQLHTCPPTLSGGIQLTFASGSNYSRWQDNKIRPRAVENLNISLEFYFDLREIFRASGSGGNPFFPIFFKY